MLIIVSLLTVILLQKVNPAQVDTKSTTKPFPSTLDSAKLSLDSLWAVVGRNKTVPKGFEKAALVAYSAYPQLKKVNIEMILTQSGAPMESNFKLNSLLGKGSSS